ncbi:ATP-dependent DNA helicase RecG [Nitrospina watsonii]|uniref:ATP-dependent DNA helicase RecG n=1 Tax=Nitrospina watsonii TaxID=1323948 RepID=A0ABN8VYY4_9BACT|nr:ATP-dependent DNA helicase RecG [Nitrospina watsonii]CAI2718910.1 ATP-dependent DNA helicase RecG [Nitrospina watsonii]
MTSQKPATPKPSLADSLQYVKGVGPKRALLLEKLGLSTVEEGLALLPHRFEDRSRVQPIGKVTDDEYVTFRATVLNAGTLRLGRRRKVFEVIFEDDTGTLRGKWFQFKESYMKERFALGRHCIVSGKPRPNTYLGAGLEIIHPDVEFTEADAPATLEMGRIVPVYPATEGLHQKSLRTIMKHLVDLYAPLLEEFLPADVMQRNDLVPRVNAYQDAHFPPPGSSADLLHKFRTPQQLRLIFEELFLIQVGLAFKRKHAYREQPGRTLKTRGDLIRRFVKLLQFEYTGAQKRVLGEIMDDLEQARPMHRLLHGDVGSGKTLVALTTLLTAVDNNLQGAMMAPTELLAEQHYLNLLPYCEHLGVKLDLITSALPSAEKKAVQQRIRDGETQIAVGTHALIQKDVGFQDLGLVVIDEQHRFGVLQREAIGKKGLSPHVLIMTATPIPRSLALTLYGDMDVSILDEMPPGRQPIATHSYDAKKRDAAYQMVYEEIQRGRQAYVVCPLIEESETLDLKTAQEVHTDLVARFPDLTIRLIHGKLKKEERQAIMTEFNRGGVDILVATTVIEVGIDVPNATLMLIEHAERFGLAQLHQLRGRVGRGAHASQCLLIAYPPLSDDAAARIEAMLKSGDGFVIAEQDLKIRGPGDFLGTRQAGMPTLRFADLVRDLKLIVSTRKEAFALIDRDPWLKEPNHQPLRDTLHRTLGDRLDLLNIL